MENYSEYTDEMLLKMMEDSYDLDESVFSVLTELGNRKHPKTKGLCIEILNRDLGFDEYYVSSALQTLYSFDEESAITYAKDHYQEFHIYSLGSLLSLLWVDSEIYKENPKKELLIKLIKNHLLTLNNEQIKKIQLDYDSFMKAYKNVQ